MDDGSDGEFDLFNVHGDGKLTVPKSGGKFQPKIGGRPIKAEVKVEEELLEAKVPVDLVEESSGHATVEKGAGATDEVMDDVDEDQVVRVIDVSLNHSPLDEHTQLYAMQYPLRPFWRPYDLEEKCENVRVKPNQTKVEFDLSIDKDCENYDNEVDDHLVPNVQTLSSSKVPLVTSYAVGVLKQNQLHLNAVDAILQFRPSMRYFKSGRIQERNNDGDMVGTSIEVNRVNVKDTSGESSSEDWARLKFCPAEHPSSTMYRQKLICEEKTPISFNMNTHDYIASLCPLKSYDSDETRGPPKRALLSMPWDERIRILFEKRSQVHRFDALMHFAPDGSVDEVLKWLLQYAVLVQGLWVSKSSLLCEGPEIIARDFILMLFSKCSVIAYEDLKLIKPDVQNRIMGPLAKRRPSLNNWKLKEPADCSFIKRYPNIVKQQETFWLSREKDIMNDLRGFGKSKHKLTKEHPRLSSCNAIPVTSNIDHSASRMNLDERQGVKTISDEAQDIVPKAITKVLRTHKVCSLSMISQRLQELALAESTVPKVDSRTSISAALEASKPLLKDMVCQVATQIHDVYVLKSVGNQALDPFRSIVIDLYRGKEHKAKLKRAEIITAAKMVLKRDISGQEYAQVMSELCVSQKGYWILKRGDGNPD